MRRSQDVDVLTSGSAKAPGLGGLRYAVPVAAIIVLADQVSKKWALSRLSAGSCTVNDACIELIGGAKFHLTFNTGAAFASLQGVGPVLGLIAIAMSLVLLVVARRRPDRLSPTLLGGIAGGAIGNLLDRMLRAEDGFLNGAVVDFIEAGSWFPWIFNVADAALVCSVVVMIALTLFWPEVLGPEVSANEVVDPLDQPDDREHEFLDADSGSDLLAPGDASDG